MRQQLTMEEVEAFRARIVRVAERLIATEGVEAVSMRQIAKAMGYSQTAAYRYFENKEEILTAVRAAILGRFCGRLEAALKRGRDPRENAKSVGRAYLQFALDDPDAYVLIFASRRPDQTLPGYSETVRRFYATLTDYVQDLIEAGHLEGDPWELGRAFQAAAHGVVMMHLNGFIGSVRARDQLHASVMRLISRGARPVKARKREQPRAARKTSARG